MASQNESERSAQLQSTYESALNSATGAEALREVFLDIQEARSEALISKSQFVALERMYKTLKVV